MTTFTDNVCIVVPTMRPPPLETFRWYSPELYQLIIVADPSVWGAHREAYGDRVIKGVRGMMGQAAMCYAAAFSRGFDWFFRLDDDLKAKTFISKDGGFPQLSTVITRCYLAAKSLGVTLVGLHNGSNRSWMQDGDGYSYGLVHGGASLARSMAEPIQRGVVDLEMRRFEDVYRSLWHREQDGAVGRVKDIGFDKRGSSGDQKSNIEQDLSKLQPEIDAIVRRFPGMVRYAGAKPMSKSNPTLIPNWKWVRPAGWLRAQTQEDMF